jgi:hypothetical protein
MITAAMSENQVLELVGEQPSPWIAPKMAASLAGEASVDECQSVVAPAIRKALPSPS